MSLSTISMTKTIKKQYVFKMKSNIDAFSSLIWIQILAMFLSFNAAASMGFANNNMDVNVQYFTGDIIMVFTMIWSFTTAITITTRPYRYHDFTFITNRVSSSLSNILFLATANLFASFTAILAYHLLKVICILDKGQQIYFVQAEFLDSLLGILAAFLYLMLVSSVGYFIGSVVQMSKAYILLISALVIALFVGNIVQENSFILAFNQFYFKETSLLLFLIKMLLSASVFFTASISLLNRLEVRK
nr:hypothetical protein [uncultured Bacillus sp.]